MVTKQAMLKKLRRVCLAFPDAVESIKWGKPHFCVREKIFAGCDDAVDRLVIGFKLEMAHAKAIIQMPGFSRAPYVGHKGWVTLDTTVFNDWPAIEELIGESYRLIAPKNSQAKLTTKSRTAPKKSPRVKAGSKSRSLQSRQGRRTRNSEI